MQVYSSYCNMAHKLHVDRRINISTEAEHKMLNTTLLAIVNNCTPTKCCLRRNATVLQRHTLTVAKQSNMALCTCVWSRLGCRQTNEANQYDVVSKLTDC